MNQNGTPVSQQFLDFIRKERIKEMIPTTMLEFNSLIRRLETKEDNEGSQTFFKTILSIESDDIQKIKNDSFAWTVNRARELKTFFTYFINLESLFYLEFCNNDYLQQKMDLSFFKYYASVNYGRVGGTTAYDEVIRLMSKMLHFFNFSFLKKDLIFLPRLPTETCYLFDPIFRQKVRENNRNNSLIRERYFTHEEFKIKEFVYICISQFVPNVGWRWTGQGHTAHYETLEMINTLFEYGLWEIHEMNELLTALYSISEIMFNLENYLHNDRNNVRNYSYFEEQIKTCTQCRELIASCFLHIILLYLDEDVNTRIKYFDIDIEFTGYSAEKYQTTKLNKEEVGELFKHSTFNKNKLYTYFSYVLVTYLGRHKFIKQNFDLIGSEKLSNLLNLLFTYISDINGDFFKVSLKMMKPSFFPFYLINDNNPFALEVENYVDKLGQMVGFVKTERYGQLNIDYNNFLDNLHKVFSEITTFLADTHLDEKFDDLTTKKLILSLYNIPQFILAFLNLIIEVDSSPIETNKVFNSGINLIRKIGINNYAGFNMMFTGYNKFHITNLYNYNVNTLNILTKEFILNSNSLVLVENNPDILKINLDVYENLLGSFFDDYDAISSDENTATVEYNFSSINFKNILALYNYNKILNRLIESFVLKRSKYELIIAEMLQHHVGVFFALFDGEDIEADTENNYDFWYDIHSTQKSFLENMKFWDNLSNNNKRMYLLELFWSFLELFNRCTTKFYSHETLGLVMQLFEDEYNISNFNKFFNIKIGCSVVSQFTRLYNNFMIFRQNHLINKRFSEFGNLETQTTELTLDDYLLEDNTKQELREISEGFEVYVSDNKFNKDANKFLYCSYFPLLFKYFNGLLNMFVYEDHKGIEKEFKQLGEEIDYYLGFIDKVNGHKDSVQILEFITVDKEKYRNKDIVDKYMENYRDLIESGKDNFLYDEKQDTDLYNLRKQGYTLLMKIVDCYNENQKKKYHLEKYIRYDPINVATKIKKAMEKKLRFNYLFRKKSNLVEDEHMLLETIENNKNPDQVLKAIKKYYKFSKTHFFENPDQNQCFIVLKTSDILKNNIEYFVNYFFSEINKMDIDFADLSNNIMINTNFFSIILMMDNLIQISPEYREKIYQMLVNPPTNANGDINKIDVFRKIWDLHKTLYYMTLYKTFFDRDWAEIYTLYYLLSNFLQNLCEDNFVKFKLWFHDNTSIKDDNKSLFMYYFTMFEAAFLNTRLHKNKTPHLSLSDKPELFFVLNRLTIGMTEFINGGAVKTQFEIYKYKIDVWVGIVLRVIDDIDNDFYELKENLLTYILGLTEGHDKSIINFMATNFPITRLYSLIHRLIKKLYIRQYLLKQRVERDKENKEGNKVYNITEEDEESHTISSTDVLMDYYKKYETSFSDHKILSVVIKIYTLMRDLSTHIVRYDNFIIAKNEDINTYIKNKTRTETNLEPLFVWNFLKEIIIDIEINYKDVNENENNFDNDDEDKSSSIKIFYFKKLPQCFFLTYAAKRAFKDRVKIDSLEEKHEQFFDEVKQYDIITKDLQSLFKKSRFLFRFSTENSMYLYQVFLYFLSVVLNIMLLIFYEADFKSASLFSGNAIPQIVGVACAIIALSFIFSVYWFLVKYPTIKKITWERYYLAHSRDKQPSFWDYFKNDIFESIFRNQTIQTFILSFLFSMLGLLINNFFYTLLLLLIIFISILVYNVALSFMVNYDKLFFTLLIILVVINSFSYLVARFYSKDFLDDDIGDAANNLCPTYFTCVMNSLNLGLRGGGGISDFMKLQPDTDQKAFYGRFFFDIFFFIFVNIILLGIFFGIIVDSFKELRDNITKRQKDEEDVCFTCGLERYVLERKGIDFEKHLEYHDIWNYFFYIVYLNWKPNNDYDGIDIYVYEHIKRDYDTAWLPLRRTLELEQKN